MENDEISSLPPKIEKAVKCSGITKRKHTCKKKTRRITKCCHIHERTYGKVSFSEPLAKPSKPEGAPVEYPNADQSRIVMEPEPMVVIAADELPPPLESQGADVGQLYAAPYEIIDLQAE
jgi:hypothetical protein